METTISSPKSWLREIEVAIEPEQLKSKISGLLDKYASEAELPGFRKGKAPRHILEGRLGPALESDAAQDLVAEATREILDEHGLTPASETRLSGLEVTPEKGLRFRLRLEVLPEFELGRYKGLRLERREPTGFDAEFDRRLRAMQDKCATFRAVARPAESGDFVAVDYRTFDRDQEVGKPRTNLLIRVGDPQNTEAVSAALLGAKPGDERSADVQLGKDAIDPELAGRLVTYRFQVREVKEKLLPEVNEELALDLGFDSLDALRQDLNDQILADRARLTKNDLKSQAVERLVREHEFEPPESWVAANLERLRQQHRPPESEETARQLLLTAARRAKFDVIAARIAKEESIEVADDEVQAEVEALAKAANRPVEELVPLLDNPGFRSQLLRDKVLELILDNAEIV